MACTSCSQPLPDGARFCPFCGQQVAATAEEERRLVTVLFADIVGYTGLVEYLDPERAKRLLDGAFERLIADIVEYGGTIDKVLGDGVLALFGAPIANEDDPDRSIRAALQMHESLVVFVAEHDELAKPVELRVGINTGEVLFGRVGGTDDYTVMGDVVNVAARLQALAPPGGIYIGDSTAALASPAIRLDAVDDLSVRGREQSEMVWQVAGLEQAQAGLRVGRDTPFVGRSSQLTDIAKVMHEAALGAGALISIMGEAGSGKTRLLAEALDQIGDDADVLIGACAPFGEANVWAPIASAMFTRLGQTATSSADVVRDSSFKKAISQYGVGAEDPLLGWLVEASLHIAGHPSSFDDMPLAQSRETLFRLIVEALRRRSSVRPLVFVIDDLQWADALLIDLLQRVSRSLADRPFLLLTAQREGVDIAWPPANTEVTTLKLRLEPLAQTEADELVEAVMGGAPDPLLASQLYERSGGNPLFLTELASLAETTDNQNELPSSLRVLIAARLDRLAPDARAIVDNAAVLGADGPIESLETFAAEMNQAFSFDTLRGLESDGLLELVSPRHWRFRSDVVREVAYQTLTKVARAERHAGVAHVMAAATGVPVGRTAHHAARAAELNLEIGPLATVPADIVDRAVGLLLQAAQRSLEIGAFRLARRDADRALDLGTSDAVTRRQLLVVRSAAATELREFDQAARDARQALESAMADADRRTEGTARRLIGVQSHGLGDFPTARQELDESISIFRSLGDDAQLAISLADRGFIEIFGGSLERADVLLDESEALAAKLGDTRAGAWALEHKAMVAFLSGDSELASQRVDAAARQFEELGDRAGTSWAQSLRAYLAFAERRLDEAEALADEARTEALKLGERWGPAMMDSLVASIRLWTGNFAEAEELAGRALEVFRDLGDRFGMVQSLAPYIRSLVALGRHGEAERGIEEAMSLSDTSGSLAFPLMIAAGTAVHLGLGDRAATIAGSGLDRVQEMGADDSEMRTVRALALCQIGRADEALALLVDLDDERPYTNSVRALAFALIADSGNALGHAALVTEQNGATYLDRVVADVAAAFVLGERQESPSPIRLTQAIETAEAAGDAVAISLTRHAAGRLLGGEPVLDQLGSGWLRVLDDLAAANG